MNVGIIGNNLTGLILAKALVNKKIKVTLFHKTKSKEVKTNRCIGITSKNIDFFNTKIFKINKKLLKQINEINIHFERKPEKKILSFGKKRENLINFIKVENLLNEVKLKLKNNNLFKKKSVNSKFNFEQLSQSENYDLIFNCERKNNLTKNLFNKSHKKNYKSVAITCNINHKKFENTTAIQIFTKFGPLAFLPLTNNQTSVVFSLYDQKKSYDNREILNLIKSYNNKYEINNFSKIEKANLYFYAARKYSKGKILLFGDVLHQIHPLAGQGFNMTLRDLKILLNIIQSKIILGLNLDQTIFVEFEKKVKPYNYIYSSGINFLQDFFKLDSKMKNNLSNKILHLISKNKIINDFFTRVADRGINIH